MSLFRNIIWGSVLSLSLVACSDEEGPYVLPEGEYLPPVVDKNVVNVSLISSLSDELLFERGRSPMDVSIRLEKLKFDIALLDHFNVNYGWTNPFNPMTKIGKSNQLTGIFSKISQGENETMTGGALMLHTPVRTSSIIPVEGLAALPQLNWEFNGANLLVSYFHIRTAGEVSACAAAVSSELKQGNKPELAFIGTIEESLFDTFVKAVKDQNPEANVNGIQSKVEVKNRMAVVVTSGKYIYRRALEYRVGETDDLKCMQIQIEYLP
ncbi:MAG: hypothetical protein ACRCX4_03115 [Bacteroidales bacterium]